MLRIKWKAVACVDPEKMFSGVVNASILPIV